MSAYPKMIYGPNGSTHTLASADSLKPDGKWSDRPSAEHFAAVSEHHYTNKEGEAADALASNSRLAEQVADIVVRKLTEAGIVQKKGVA